MARTSLTLRNIRFWKKLRTEVNSHKTTLDAAEAAGASNSLKWYKVAAGNGAGARTMTGAAVGDVVILVWNVTDSTIDAADAESTITVADQIQQTATNHTGDTWLIETRRPVS